jgi:hypothetical protein
MPQKLNTQVVADDDCYHKNGDESTRVDLLSRDPVLKDKGGSGELIRSDNNIFEPVTMLPLLENALSTKVS